MNRTLVLALSLSLSACAAGFRPGESRGVGVQQGDDLEEPGSVEEFAVKPAPAPPGAAELGLRGHFAWREHRLEEALELFQAASAQAPVGTRQVYERAAANTLLGLRRFAAAEVVLRRLLLEDGLGNDSLLHSNLALACLRQGQHDVAREAASRALQLDPGNFEALKTLGLVDLASGNLAGARERLTLALASREDIPEAQVALAELEILAGEASRALKRYQRLLDWLPGKLAEDSSRRWRDLFHPSDVHAELQARMAVLTERPSSP